MSAFDENRDGYIERNEAIDQREFQASDVNRDGALNRREFAAVNNPREFNRADTNRDGIVDAPEFARSEAAVSEKRRSFHTHRYWNFHGVLSIKYCISYRYSLAQPLDEPLLSVSIR